MLFESSPFLWFIYATDNTALKITMTEEVKRGKVPVGFHAGRSPWAIAEFNELSLSFVYQMKRKLQVSEHHRGYRHHTQKVCPLLKQSQDTRFCGDSAEDGGPGSQKVNQVFQRGRRVKPVNASR